MKDITIIINNRNRVTTLCELVTWLLDHQYYNLIVLDNDSDYPPLMEYYDAIDGMVQVVKLTKNLLSKALWCWTAARKSIRGPFVYTDSDIVPTSQCPDDVVGFLAGVADTYGTPNKVGLGLKIDDLPDHYSQAPFVRKWESQNWKRQIGKVQGVPIYAAGVDTTFAFYPEFRPFSLDGIRTGFPYLARHLPWYVDSANPSEEELYYDTHAAKGCHNWAIDSVHSQAVKNYCKVR